MMMANLCECPDCGGRLRGILSSKHFIENKVFCGSCGFTESLVDAVARHDGSQVAKDDIPIYRLAMVH
jgi:ribosomal protein S27AE